MIINNTSYWQRLVFLDRCLITGKSDSVSNIISKSQHLLPVAQNKKARMCTPPPWSHHSEWMFSSHSECKSTAEAVKISIFPTTGSRTFINLDCSAAQTHAVWCFEYKLCDWSLGTGHSDTGIITAITGMAGKKTKLYHHNIDLPTKPH